MKARTECGVNIISGATGTRVPVLYFPFAEGRPLQLPKKGEKILDSLHVVPPVPPLTDPPVDPIGDPNTPPIGDPPVSPDPDFPPSEPVGPPPGQPVPKPPPMR